MKDTIYRHQGTIFREMREAHPYRSRVYLLENTV
jgi:hypothetical protein